MKIRDVLRENLKKLRSIVALAGLLALSLHDLVPHGHVHADAMPACPTVGSHDRCGQKWLRFDNSLQRSQDTTQSCHLCNELRRGAGLDFRESAALIPPSSEGLGPLADNRSLAYLVESQSEARGPPSA